MTLDEAFDTFAVDAWRLEARDVYRAGRESEESLSAFLRDGTPPAPSTDWNDVIKDAAERGARVGRIRLVSHPITDYTRWEFLAYRNNSDAGENILIVDRSWLDDSWTNAPDVWVFDGQVAFLQRYATDGTYLGAKEVDAAPYVTMRHRLEPWAVPLIDYRLAEIPVPRPAVGAPASLPAGITTTG